MILNKNKNDEINYKDKDKELFLTKKTNDIPKSLDNKYKILNHFINYFDDLQKKEGNENDSTDIQTKDMNKVNNKNNIIYVDKIILLTLYKLEI
jgi:hypothetical protein